MNCKKSRKIKTRFLFKRFSSRMKEGCIITLDLFPIRLNNHKIQNFLSRKFLIHSKKLMKVNSIIRWENTDIAVTILKRAQIKIKLIMINISIIIKINLVQIILKIVVTGNVRFTKNLNRSFLN